MFLLLDRRVCEAAAALPSARVKPEPGSFPWQLLPQLQREALVPVFLVPFARSLF